MKIETERLVLREMRAEDYDALYAVLADSDIMQHYPYTFEEARVRGWIARNIERYTYPVNADWKEVFAVIDNMMTELP